MVEDQHAAVAKRLERRHVAAVEMPANASSGRGAPRSCSSVCAPGRSRAPDSTSAARLLMLSSTTGCPGRSTACACQRSRSAATRRSRAAITPPIGQGRHCRACASNINTRTRPVPPNTRIAICGPRRAATYNVPLVAPPSGLNASSAVLPIRSGSSPGARPLAPLTSTIGWLIRSDTSRERSSRYSGGVSGGSIARSISRCEHAVAVAVRKQLQARCAHRRFRGAPPPIAPA